MLHSLSFIVVPLHLILAITFLRAGKRSREFYLAFSVVSMVIAVSAFFDPMVTVVPPFMVLIAYGYLGLFNAITWLKYYDWEYWE